MQITIESNVGLVRQGLEDLQGEIPKIGRRRMYDAMVRITSKMKKYPPERPNQRYVRTFKFRNSWSVNRTDAGYVIKNSASRKGREYGHWVVGNAYGTTQAWMHQGRWQLFRDVVDDEIDKLPKEVADKIDLVARRKLPQGGM